MDAPETRLSGEGLQPVDVAAPSDDDNRLEARAGDLEGEESSESRTRGLFARQDGRLSTGLVDASPWKYAKMHQIVPPGRRYL